MDNAKGKVKTMPRDRSLPLMVYVNDTERAAIQGAAAAVGMSVSAFLRAVGTYQSPRKVPNRKAIDGLADANADIGRVLRSLAGRVEPEVIRQVEMVQMKLREIAEAISQ